MTSLPVTSGRSLYAAFDRFPTRKGASTHIARFAPTLFHYTGGGLLYVLGDDALPAHQIEGAIEILRFCEPIPNFLDRAVAFGLRLETLLEARGQSFAICHFRDPWSGVPILARERGYATVFEVNALPSIELPSAFPGITPRTLEKIRASEMFCLHTCDRIVTPSHTTRRMLCDLGVDDDKISVIANGADLPAPQARPVDAPSEYILYFGALQSWQGVDVLLRAFARLADLESLRLVICGSARSRQVRQLERLAQRLGIASRMIWHWSLPNAELAPWLAHAQLSVAPLRDCTRNVVQGCAPLKILESMAAGVPVIASRLPPVGEILSDGIEGCLVAADRPDELARAIRVLLAYPELRAQMGARGRTRVAADFHWPQLLCQLRALYATLRPAAEFVGNDGSGVAAYAG
ncbi:MAG: glycosyltransferase family 4 protein [Pseudomarimonas sp.]